MRTRIERATPVEDMANDSRRKPGLWTVRMVERMREAGFTTLGDLADASLDRIKQIGLSKSARESVDIVRDHIHVTDRQLGERIPFDKKPEEMEADHDDTYSFLAVGVMMSPAMIEKLDNLLARMNGQDAAEIRAEIKPYADHARENRRVEIDPDADAVQWTHAEGGYRIRVGLWDPGHLEPCVRVFERWDAELFGEPVTIVNSSPKPSASRYMVFKNIDTAASHFLGETNRLESAKRLAYHKMRNMRPTVVPKNLASRDSLPAGSNRINAAARLTS